MKSFFALFIALIAALSAHAAFAGSIYDSLSPADQAKIQKGEQVFITEKMPNSAWPKATLYLRIDNASAEEVAAVLWDIKDYKNFIPDMIKSDLAQVVSKNSIQGDFTLRMPVFIPNENYSVLNTVKMLDPETYDISWTMVRSEASKHIEGYGRFEPLGTGTLMAYQNFVIPKSGIAGIVKDAAMKGVRTTAVAVGNRAVQNRTNDKKKMDEQLELLRKALN